MSEDTANTHSDGGLSRRSLLTGSTALVAAAAAIGAQSQAVAQAQAPAQAPAASPRKPPNILVIFGDDIGIPQISAYTMGLMGYRTPNIDRIAAEGRSSPIPTASRAARPAAPRSSWGRSRSAPGF